MSQSETDMGSLGETERTRRDQGPELTATVIPGYLRRHRLIVGAVAVLLGISAILVGKWDPLALLDTSVGVNVIGLFVMLMMAWRRPGPPW